jgi:RNA polymerase sigma-70 factor (ECF subfamily)
MGMQTKLSDQELLYRIKSGNEAAIDEVYLRYWSLTRKHVLDNSSSLHLSKDELEEEARNLHQEVILAVYRNVLEGKVYQLERDDLKPYLRQIIQNKWLNELRRIRRHRNVPLEEKHENSAEGYENTREFMEPVIDYDARLQHVLSQLDEVCDRILRMFYFERCSMEQVAQQCGLRDAEAAKKRKYKCLEKAKSMVAL